jgi:transposase
MIQITPHMRIYLCIAPIDFRKGIDGLAQVCREILDKDPFSGSMFIFRNKRKTTLKILIYDGQGFWLYVKRLSSGKFNCWPNSNPNSLPQNEKASSISLTPAQLHLLIWNGNLPDANADARIRTPLTALNTPQWKNITPAA